MTIFQCIDLPMPIGNGVFLSLSSDHDTLVISTDSSLFRTTTSTEMGDDSIRLGDFYACPLGNVARRSPTEENTAAHIDDIELCLWSLFISKPAIANEACTKTITRLIPKAIQVSACQFITYGASSGNNITCRRSGLGTNFKTTAFGHLSHPLGCEARSETFEISSGDAGFTRHKLAWPQHLRGHLPRGYLL